MSKLKFYRYYDRRGYNGPVIELQVYYLVKETPSGYWITSNSYWSTTKFPYKKRWVSKTARKRRAYPTKLEAMESFIARKHRQQMFAELTLNRVNSIIQNLNSEKPIIGNEIYSDLF